MKAGLRMIAGAFFGIGAVVSLGTAAGAQVYNQQNPTYNQQSPNYNQQRPPYRRQPTAPPTYGFRNGQQPGNGTTVQVLPPDSLGPGSLGLLERDFEYMRSTSRDPDHFLHGRWNPRYQVVGPAVTVYPGAGGYYGGGWPAYGAYGYYNPYGGFGGYYGPQVVQPQVIIVPGQGATPQPAAPAQPSTQPMVPARPDTAPPSGDTGKGDDFYLKARPTDESFSDALDDIRKAWLNGDWDRLKSRFETDGKVRIYPRGHYKYSVDSQAFATMLKDAMARIDTVSFDFDRPKPQDGGKVFVTGKHVFTDADKSKQTTYISYTLQRVQGRWKIVEAGSSLEPISAHTD